MSTCQILNRQVDDSKGHHQDMKLRYLTTSCEDIFLTSRHNDLTSQHKDLTCRHNYLTSDGRNMPP